MSSYEQSRKFSVEPASNDAPKEDFTVVTITDDASNIRLQCNVPVSFEEYNEPDDSDNGGDPSKVDIYENEYNTRPPIASMFSKLTSYTGGIEPTTEEAMMLKDKQQKTKTESKLGTLLGVFLPCIQNIFGVILFLRMSWISGVAGGLLGFLIVLICCCTTFLTALSMSAIATNGKVPAGGSYFMISRSIGPEFGGAVGLLFYIGTTIASAMYIIGAVEVFLKYICPQAAIGGDISDDTVLFNNTRMYGTCLLIILMCCVFIGIQFVSKFAAISLFAVLISILCIYLGVFTVESTRSPVVCVLGQRLLARSYVLDENGTLQCDKRENGVLYKLYCNSSSHSDESCKFFNKNEVVEFAAMPGLSSDLFFKNFLDIRFKNKGDSYDDDPFPPKKEFGQLPNIADISTSFFILLAIYFPSVTGIMAGSNRSGDLANPQVSIPRGTIAAIIITSCVYLSSMLLFCAVADGRVLRDKFGESVGGGMLVASIGWPHAYVVLVGSLLSTIGAGLQSLTGAPRLLQAISQDNILPFLRVFRHTTKRGEPFYAQLLTMAISLMGVLIASLDSITPLVTMFFLMCYGFVNLATALNHLIKEPNWRPRHKFYHWTLSLLGVALCATLMFISSWYYALFAFGLAGGIYKYIEYKGASKEWGDATRGLQLTAAKRAILTLGTKPIHTKNWRPQILIYLPIDEKHRIYHQRLLDLVYQLKAGKGLTLVASIIKGDLFQMRPEADELKNNINEIMRAKRIKGLPEVLISKDLSEGMRNMAQCAGLGNLRHNTIMVSFPDGWRDNEKEVDELKLHNFLTLTRAAQACNLAMIVPKNIDQFPQAQDRLSGTIDLWCVVQDGGLLILIAYLLLNNRAWSRCRLRVFLVATPEMNAMDLKNAMSNFVFDLRVSAEVDVVEMSSADISAYSTQRTIGIMNRQQMLQEFNLQKVADKSDIQTILDKQHIESGLTKRNSVDKNTSPTDKVTLTEDNDLQAPTLTITDPDDTGAKGRSGGSSVTFTAGPGPAAMAREATEASQMNHLNSNDSDKIKRLNEFTFSPGMMAQMLQQNAAVANQTSGFDGSLSPCGQNVKPLKRKMHSASNLNRLIIERSSEAALVLINMPGPSKSPGSEYNYMDFIETLTVGLRRVLLIRGSGREVITAFSE